MSPARVCVAVVLAALVLAPAAAQAGEMYDRFGVTMAADGERIAIAAPYSNEAGFDGGVVDVYHLNDGTWRFEQQVSLADPRPLGRFGATVALAGELLVVGSSPTRGPGLAWVFERGEGGWTELAALSPGADVSDHEFSRVGAAEGWVAVGTPFVVRDGQPEPGEIHMFERTGDGLALRQVLAGEPGARRRFGSWFHLAGSVLVVGVEGALETYVRAGAMWSLEGEMPAFADANTSLVESAFDGQTLVLVEWPERTIRLRTREGGGWSQPQTVALADVKGVRGPVTVAGEWAAAVTRREAADNEPEPPDEIRLLRREGGVWGEAGVITREVVGDSFGAAVALAGGWLWVGAPAIQTVEPGQALAYRREGEGWSPVMAVEAGGREADAGGCAISSGSPLGLLVLGFGAWRRRRARR